MAPGSLTLAGGLALGLASSLHCAAMCGPIGASLMFGLGERRARALAPALFGRVFVYALAGALAGAAGGALFGAEGRPLAFLAMRAAAALTLGWIGFSLVGLAPSLTAFDRLGAPVSRALSRARPGAGGAFAAGLAWGLMPCGLVYGALFYAGLAGGPLQGAGVMAGFGVGTLPSVTAAALGVVRFRALARAPEARVAVGLGLMALAALSLAAPAAALAVFCRP